jgi:hypothetical protein
MKMKMEQFAAVQSTEMPNSDASDSHWGGRLKNTGPLGCRTIRQDIGS